MKQRIYFVIYSWLFWIIYFQFARLLFISYHIRQFIKIPIFSTFQSFVYGLWLDISIASYLSVVPLFLVVLSTFFTKHLKDIWKCYTIGIISITSFMIMVDMELFAAWGFRLDATIIRYIHSPTEAVVSTLSSPIFILLFLGFAQFFIGLLLLKKWIYKYSEFAPIPFWWSPLFILLNASLIIPIRGGFQLAPVNESTVFFSDISIVNQAAINCVWSFAHSLTEQSYNDKNPYMYFSDEEANELFQTCMATRKSKNFPFLRNNKPNIIFIIWESGTAKAQTNYDGKEIVPQLKALKDEGIYFENCFASGMRTDKGLIAILSGYPAQPNASIIMNPTKSSKLPSITKSLKNNDYSTLFIYGGEPEFANIKSYLLASGFNKVIGKKEFDESQWNSKWGAHDEYTFNRLLDECSKSKTPFFNTLLTLTSHEPFEIPCKPLLATDTRERLFLNSIHYTDSCLGDFIQKSKKCAWWNNTLIVIVADHGHPMPGVGFAEHLPQDYKIPLLLLGGALDTANVKIQHTMSQTDIPNIVLNQLNISDSAFVFGTNCVIKPTNPSAYYSFNDGFAFLTDSTAYLHSNTGDRTIWNENNASPHHINTGKAYLQYSFRDYLAK